MIGWSFIPREDPELVSAVTEVARAVLDRDQFSAAAKRVADRFGTRALTLRRRLHKLPATPPEFDHENPITEFCNWLLAWQMAIIEVFFHLHARAIHAVHRIAFGRYDWMQPDALIVLCRWSVGGMDHVQTIAPILGALPRLDDRATKPLAGWLAAQARTDPRYAEIAEEFRRIPAFEEIWQEIAHQADGESAAAVDQQASR